MKVEVSTYHYEAAHGHRPSGRGTWMFEARYSSGKDPVTKADGSPFFNGLYSEAKKEATARVKELAAGTELDWVELIVCS